MIDIRKEADALASWPTPDRLRALKRILPRARVEDVLARAGHDRHRCARLPGWFMVWFVVALGLFSRERLPGFDKTTYRRRNVVERCIGWMKSRRRLATRFEKLAENFLAMVKLAMIERLLKALLPDTA